MSGLRVAERALEAALGVLEQAQVEDDEFLIFVEMVSEALSSSVWFWSDAPQEAYDTLTEAVRNPDYSQNIRNFNGSLTHLHPRPSDKDRRGLSIKRIHTLKQARKEEIEERSSL